LWCSKQCSDFAAEGNKKIAAVESIMRDADTRDLIRIQEAFDKDLLDKANVEHGRPPRNRAKDERVEPTRKGDGWEGKVGGYAPVQGWGEVDGLPWYFRSRWDSWRFSIAYDPDANPVKVGWGEVEGWQKEGTLLGEYFAASWMPVEDAWVLIEEAIEEFRESRSGV
jgi:hypothetical protein